MIEESKDKGCAASCGCGGGVKKTIINPCFIKLLLTLLVFFLLVGIASHFITIHFENPNKPSAAMSAMSIKTVMLERSDLKIFPIEVQVAVTLEQQRKGLMNRKALPQNKGMLFTYEQPQVVRFWMKDTLLPLDILFVSPDGTIHKIVQGAKPHDETPIPSGQPVIAVLELKAGEVKRLGLSVWDSLLQ